VILGLTQKRKIIQSKQNTTLKRDSEGITLTGEAF